MLVDVPIVHRILRGWVDAKLWCAICPPPSARTYDPLTRHLRVKEGGSSPHTRTSCGRSWCGSRCGTRSSGPSRPSPWWHGSGWCCRGRRGRGASRRLPLCRNGAAAHTFEGQQDISAGSTNMCQVCVQWDWVCCRTSNHGKFIGIRIIRSLGVTVTVTKCLTGCTTRNRWEWFRS